MIRKVTGIRSSKALAQAFREGADIVTLNFIPGADCYVRSIPSHAGIIPDRASSLRHSGLCGVFRDDMPQNIITRVVNYSLSIIQLDGGESPVMIDNLRRTLVPDFLPSVTIIKTIDIASADDILRCEEYEGKVDYFLFRLPSVVQSAEFRGSAECRVQSAECRVQSLEEVQSATAQPNSALCTLHSALKEDSALLDAYRGSTPFILSAGLKPSDAPRFEDCGHKLFAGIECSAV